MGNPVDIVQSIVDRIDKETKVISVVGTKISVCSTLWITLGKEVKDENGNAYMVTDFEFDQWIEVTPKGASPSPFVGLKVVAPTPLFMHGTPSSVNAEYVTVKSRRTLSKTPFIWMLESLQYDDMPRESSIELSMDARLFFMDWANVKKWLNDDHNKYAIKPMQNLVKAFKQVILDDFSIRNLETFTVRTRSRFGVEVANKGNISKILDEDLSGCDVGITLDIYDVEQCVSNC